MGVIFELALFLCCLRLAAGQTDILNTSGICRYTWYIPPNGRSYSLRSPNFPNKFRPGSNCFWYLYTDSGSKVDLDCANVSLDKNRCSWGDKLTVFGSGADDNYCDAFRVRSTNNKMLLSLTSDSFSSGGSFSCVVRAPRVSEDCDCGWTFRTKIVGGEETGVNEFPFMVSLIDVNRRGHACGGTIISPKYIVTAAHCLMALSPATTGVLVGEHDLSTSAETNATALYRTRRFIFHPDWSAARAKNDIGLIEVERPIVYSMRVGPICLPFNWPDTPELNEVLTVLGWGTISFGGPVSNVLMKTTLRVVPISRCQDAFQNSGVTPDTQFCTFEPGRDSCQMDSGGPLLSSNPRAGRYFLSGIVSFGGVCGIDDPSVSTRVAHFLDWIQRITGENFCRK